MSQKQIVSVAVALFIAGVTANVGYMFRVEARMATLETKIDLVLSGKIKTFSAIETIKLSPKTL